MIRRRIHAVANDIRLLADRDRRSIATAKDGLEAERLRIYADFYARAARWIEHAEDQLRHIETMEGQNDEHQVEAGR
jgi:hypothetical protein